MRLYIDQGATALFISAGHNLQASYCFEYKLLRYLLYLADVRCSFVLFSSAMFSYTIHTF